MGVVARRNDLADVAWGLGFITSAAWLLLREGAPLTVRQFVLSALVATWGFRLAYHIARRNLRPGRGEDERYAQWRRDWGEWFVARTYLQVILLQGLFLLLLATQVRGVGSAGGPPFGVPHARGVAGATPGGPGQPDCPPITPGRAGHQDRVSACRHPGPDGFDVTGMVELNRNGNRRRISQPTQGPDQS